MSLVCKEGASRMRSFCMISECTLFLDYIFARFRGCIQDEILEENGSVSSPLQENGTSDSLSLITSEMAVEEIIEQPIQGIDEHLVEFSEALRRSHDRDPHNKGKGTLDLVDQPKVCLPENGENGHCCGANGICNHEVLRDGGSTSYSESVNKKIPKKASFKLSWNSEGANGNQYKHDLVSFDRGSRTTTGRSSKQIFLKWDSKPQTVLVLTKRKSTSVRLLCCELVTWLRERNLNIYVTREVKSELEKDSPYFDFVQSWEDGKEVLLLHTKIDLVVTLGGDGTVIWAASLFKGPVPLVVPIAMGSLGFMTPFHSEKYKESLESVLHGTINITLRHRLLCNVIRGPGKDESDTEGTYLVLNEITIDRGISPFLTNLECSCDGTYMTRVQGDGLILSTTSGSTAYSLAAGGSMVHPQVPGILFTPICPHSLSFRPLILPEEVTLEVRVPYDSRSGAYASFDGKDRKELRRGDALICRMAPWPVPTACQRDSTSDFLCSIREGLHWNLRKTQGADGPPVAST